MSTTETKPFIPSADAITLAAGDSAYRFSKGRIVAGREEAGTFREVPRLVGIVTRIGIHEGVTKEYNKPYMQVECDMLTSDGEIHVHAGLLDNEDFTLRPTQGALSYAWCLTQVKPGQVYMLSASKGDVWTDDKGRPREASTYVNLATVDDKSLAHPVYRPKIDPYAPKKSNNEKWEALRTELQSHSLFAPRPASRKDEPSKTHLAELTAEVAAKGWPTPAAAPDAWLTLLSKLFRHEKRAALVSYSEDEWGEVALAIKKTDAMPGILKSALPAAPPAATVDLAALEGEDPFAE